MKKLFNTNRNRLTFLLIAIIGLVFTSCETKTIIQERIVEVEVPVIQIDSVFVQESAFGSINYTQIIQGDNTVLQPGLNHYAHIEIQDYQGFELDMDISMNSGTYIDGNVFNDGSIIIQTNETGMSQDLDNDEVDLEGIMNLGEGQISTFDIYINADLLRNSAVTEPELYIRLQKEEYFDDENRLTRIRFNKEYNNSENDEDLGIIGLNNETPIELRIDIDTGVAAVQNEPTLTRGEINLEIEQESGENLLLDVNSFEFSIDGIDYNIQNLPSNIIISTDSEADQFPDAYLIPNNNERDVEIMIIAPTGTLVILKSYSWSGENTNFSSFLYLNESIQM